MTVGETDLVLETESVWQHNRLAGVGLTHEKLKLAERPAIRRAVRIPLDLATVTGA